MEAWDIIDPNPDMYNKYTLIGWPVAYWLAGEPRMKKEPFHTRIKERDAWDVGDPEGLRSGHIVKLYEALPAAEQ